MVIEQAARRALSAAVEPSLRRAINATGVVVHTNLGRAPLAGAAIERLGAIAGSYSNLEFDLEAGRRGRRDLHAEALLQRLLGVEAAVVVNNNAAATLVMLAALASGRDVVVSRGELVEIGGGFRVPDVMAQSGARLREVGTTNRTRIDDYRDAIGPDTALLLRVHRSNFRIEGFTEQPTLEELVRLGRERAVPVAEDIGSGYVGLVGEDDAPRLDGLLAGEPRVQSSVEAGLDVVCFSGDKLLGGPQAGILAGRRDLVAKVRRHPLMRALRVDKLTYAALEATLGEYVAGRASRTIPILRMILATPDAIRERARRVADRGRRRSSRGGDPAGAVGGRRRNNTRTRAADVGGGLAASDEERRLAGRLAAAAEGPHRRANRGRQAAARPPDDARGGGRTGRRDTLASSVEYRGSRDSAAARDGLCTGVGRQGVGTSRAPTRDARPSAGLPPTRKPATA